MTVRLVGGLEADIGWVGCGERAEGGDRKHGRHDYVFSRC